MVQLTTHTAAAGWELGTRASRMHQGTVAKGGAGARTVVAASAAQWAASCDMGVSCRDLRGQGEKGSRSTSRPAPPAQKRRKLASFSGVCHGGHGRALQDGHGLRGSFSDNTAGGAAFLIIRARGGGSGQRTTSTGNHKRGRQSTLWRALATALTAGWLAGVSAASLAAWHGMA